MSEEPIRGNYNPGAGGWPTIRYFNKDTGYEGAPYTKKTDEAMCTELGQDEYMFGYVEEAGKTSLCSVPDGAGCSEKEKAFIAKMSGSPDKVATQLTRLTKMAADGHKMAPDLQKWLSQRLKILQKLSSATDKAEL